MAFCVVPGMPSSGSAAATHPSSSTPRTVPSTVPTPPLIDTPPITTAAMTWNSKPAPVLDGFTKPQRLAYRMPASPDSAPDSVNTSSVTRVTSIPRSGAATGFEPNAKICRPTPCVHDEDIGQHRDAKAMKMIHGIPRIGEVWDIAFSAEGTNCRSICLASEMI